MRRAAFLVTLLTSTIVGCSGSRNPGARDAADDFGGEQPTGNDAGDTGSGEGPRLKCGQGSTVGFIKTEFKSPDVQCRWDQMEDVQTSPLVVDLDGDGRPEILFSGLRVHAISGTDCKELWSSGDAFISDIAAGDLDGDGTIEIVGHLFRGNDLAVLDGATGKLVDTFNVDFASTTPGTLGLTGAALANIDGKGPAEIVSGTSVFTFEGRKLGLLWSVRPYTAADTLSNLSTDGPTAVADLDGDGLMEVIGRYQVFDGTSGFSKLDFGTEGFPAVADFDPASPGPEIVRVNYTTGATTVVAGLLAPAPGKVLFGPYGAGAQGAGHPAVADFDGDGGPEIGVVSGKRYTVYDRDCAATPLPAKCVEPGVLWWKQVQGTSGILYASSTAFDFNCDGRAEALYQDECFLRVFEGETGQVLFATSMTSSQHNGQGTAVADTTALGHARIVVTSGRLIQGATCPAMDEHTGTPSTGVSQGVMVLKDPMDRWQATSRIWNQETYHVTNVRDDGSIPLLEPDGWKSANVYRANVPF